MSYIDGIYICDENGIENAMLYGATLYHRQWEPANPQNDHDHCEYCFYKFEDSKQTGYCTKDRYYWLCEACFNRFSKLLNLTVEE